MEITRRHEWDMGHRLPDHKGLCRNLHGHRYAVEVTVTGPLQQAGPSGGMVADFFDLDVAIRDVIRAWDHAVMLQHTDPLLSALQKWDVDRLDAGMPVTEILRIVKTDQPPTAEVMAEMIGTRLLREWPGGEHNAEVTVDLVSVTVWETPRSRATWWSHP